MRPKPARRTLLERLLAPEIRRERSTLLQCVRFVVANAARFLDGDDDAPLIFPPGTRDPAVALAAGSDDNGNGGGGESEAARRRAAQLQELPPPLDEDELSSEPEEGELQW